MSPRPIPNVPIFFLATLEPRGRTTGSRSNGIFFEPSGTCASLICTYILTSTVPCVSKRVNLNISILLGRQTGQRFAAVKLLESSIHPFDSSLFPVCSFLSSLAKASHPLHRFILSPKVGAPCSNLTFLSSASRMKEFTPTTRAPPRLNLRQKHRRFHVRILWT